MKFAKLLVISLISFTTAFSFANNGSNPTTPTDDTAPFIGTWKGTGVYRLNGVQSNCQSVEMTFEGTATSFTFVGGTRDCDNHSETFYKVTMDYANGKLFFSGQEVGTIEGNVLTSQFSMKEKGGRVRHWRMSMRADGDTLMYEENRIMDNEKTPMISFAGILAK